MEAIGLSGTGGLLIIYAKLLNNNASIQANGVQNEASAGASGGSSGGGSINLFYSLDESNLGNIEAKGGSANESSATGGAGGNGCVSTDKITL